MPLADADALRAHGLWAGLNRWVAAVVVLGACGGVMVSVVFTYADNILKSFAVGLSIVLSAIISWAIFGTACTPTAAAGIALVIVSSLVYQMNEAHPIVLGSYARLEQPFDAAGCDVPADEPAAEELRLVKTSQFGGGGR